MDEETRHAMELTLEDLLAMREAASPGIVFRDLRLTRPYLDAGDISVTIR